MELAVVLWLALAAVVGFLASARGTIGAHIPRFRALGFSAAGRISVWLAQRCRRPKT